MVCSLISHQEKQCFGRWEGLADKDRKNRIFWQRPEKASIPQYSRLLAPINVNKKSPSWILKRCKAPSHIVIMKATGFLSFRKKNMGGSTSTVDLAAHYFSLFQTRRKSAQCLESTYSSPYSVHATNYTNGVVVSVIYVALLQREFAQDVRRKCFLALYTPFRCAGKLIAWNSTRDT